MKKVGNQYQLIKPHLCSRDDNVENNNAAKSEMIKRCLIMTLNLREIYDEVCHEWVKLYIKFCMFAIQDYHKITTSFKCLTYGKLATQA